MQRLTVRSHFRRRGFLSRPPRSKRRHQTRSLALKVDEVERTLHDAQRLLAEVEGWHPEPVRDHLRFVHQHLFEPSFNADAVRRAFPGSRARTAFLKATGKTPRAYIEDARLLVSLRLLQHTHIEIYLVADAVGYAYYETFFRAFKRHVGCAPSEVREWTPDRLYVEVSSCSDKNVM